MPAQLWVGFSAVSPQFPPCMKPAACGCACANSSPGCCFCLCPSSSSSSSLLCLVSQGPAVACKALDLHQPSCVEELLGTDLVTSLAVLSGSSSDPSLPLGRSLQGTSVYSGCGHRAKGSLASCPFFCYPCPSASNSCLSLSPFPSVCVRLLTGRIQVSSGNAFSLPRGRVHGPFLARTSLGWSCCSRGCSCPENKLGRAERHWPGWE